MGDVHPPDLRTAADHADDAVFTVRTNKPSEIGQVGAALEGAGAGGVASQLEETWTTAYTTWVTDMEAYAELLRSIATAWETADADSSSAFDGLSGPTPTPVP